MFFASVADAVIVSPIVYDGRKGGQICSLDENIEYRIDLEREWSNPGLDIFPADDCFWQKEEAQVAFEAETGEAW